MVLLAGTLCFQNNAGETVMVCDNLFSDMDFGGKTGYLEDIEDHTQWRYQVL